MSSAASLAEGEEREFTIRVKMRGGKDACCYAEVVKGDEQGK
jgi:hypothetical protein